MLYADSILSVLQPYAQDKTYNLFYAEAYLDMGDILFKQKRYNEAYYSFYKGKASILPSDNPCDNPLFLFGFQTRLANISYGQGRYLESAAWHKKAIAALQLCHTDTNQVFMVQGALDNIALSYTQAGVLDTAMLYYDKALELLRSVTTQKYKRQQPEFEMARGVILGNQGTIYFKKDSIQTAVRKFKESIAINSKPGYENEDAMITRMKLADADVILGKLDEVKRLIDTVSAAKGILQVPQSQLHLIMLRASYAKSTGKAAEANELLQQYVNMMKLQKNDSKKLMFTDFDREFELLQRQYDLLALKRQNQEKSIYLIGALITCLMAVAIIYLVQRNNRRARQSIRQTELHNRQLEITLNALENSSQENARLTRVVAHDLKNPVSAIYGISALMADDPERSTDDLELLNLIKSSSKSLDTIIIDLLAAKAQDEDEQTKKVRINVSELLRSSVSLLQYRAKEKQQHIVLKTNEDHFVMINQERIWRVINNLIVNAIKFSKEHTQVDVSYQSKEGQVIVCIRDKGIGIPEELQKKIFQLSTDAKRQGTSGEETFGLGLYISKQIVEEHGGEIWLESTEGQGTSFYFSLPESPL